MTKTKKIILLFVAFICLFGVMYSADFETKPFLTNIINPFLAIAADTYLDEVVIIDGEQIKIPNPAGFMQTSKSIYEQGEQMEIIIKPNSDIFSGYFIILKNPAKSGASMTGSSFVQEILPQGGTYYYTLPLDALLGNWEVIMTNPTKAPGAGFATGCPFEVVKTGEGSDDVTLGPEEKCIPLDQVPYECILPDSITSPCAKGAWYLAHPECLKYKNICSAEPSQPGPQQPEQPEQEEGQPAAIECPPLPPACQLFYIKKEDTNKCIETLKASNVYSSDPCGQKVESMIIIPGI